VPAFADVEALEGIVRSLISHAANDELQEALVDLLAAGAGVPLADIFCSSSPGAIPGGFSDTEYILQREAEAGLIVSIISRTYLERPFCIGEASVGRVLQISKSAIFQPLLVPPVRHTDLKGALAGMQAPSIDNRDAMNDLYHNATKGNPSPPNISIWNSELAIFQEKVKAFVAKEQARELVGKIVPLDVYLDRGIFKLKLRLVFRNDTGKDVYIVGADWNETADVPRHDKHPLVFEIEDVKEGGWKKNRWLSEQSVGTSSKCSVPAGRVFRVWIGLQKQLDNIELRRWLVQQRVGTIQIDFEILGQTAKFTRQF
jgi:hypothetical protein